MRAEGGCRAVRGRPMLTPRASTILNLLVHKYVQTATPVASDDIARKPALQVSPATVRSAMSQLTEEGYISRPHISAGGVPSDLGYRHFVESLPEPPELPGRLRRQVDRSLEDAESEVGLWASRCAQALSLLTANLTIVTEPRARLPRLKRIQLVFMHETAALLVVVLGGTRLLKRLLPLDEAVDQGRLDQAAGRLNELMAGRNLREIGGAGAELNELERRVRRDSIELLRVAQQEDSPQHHTEGLGRLLHQPEFAAGERARELVELVESRALPERLASAAGGPQRPAVYIGSENPDAALRNFSVVICRYGAADGIGGVIGVVGPRRMSYRTAIAGTHHLSALLSRMVQGLQGRPAR